MYKPALVTMLIVQLSSCTPAWASKAPKFTDRRAVAAIIGEVAGEGGSNMKLKFEAMVACAHAIRNRGTLKGVFGEHNPIVKTEPEWVWKMAWKAWMQSAKDKDCGVDPTCGATHWENIKAFGEPYWKKEMVVTAKIGNHVYMKRKGKV